MCYAVQASINFLEKKKPFKFNELSINKKYFKFSIKFGKFLQICGSLHCTRY